MPFPYDETRKETALSRMFSGGGLGALIDILRKQSQMEMITPFARQAQLTGKRVDFPADKWEGKWGEQLRGYGWKNPWIDPQIVAEKMAEDEYLTEDEKMNRATSWTRSRREFANLPTGDLPTALSGIPVGRGQTFQPNMEAIGAIKPDVEFLREQQDIDIRRANEAIADAVRGYVAGNDVAGTQALNRAQMLGFSLGGPNVPSWRKFQEREELGTHAGAIAKRMADLNERWANKQYEQWLVDATDIPQNVSEAVKNAALQSAEIMSLDGGGEDFMLPGRSAPSLEEAQMLARQKWQELVPFIEKMFPQATPEQMQKLAGMFMLLSMGTALGANKPGPRKATTRDFGLTLDELMGSAGKPGPGAIDKISGLLKPVGEAGLEFAKVAKGGIPVGALIPSEEESEAAKALAGYMRRKYRRAQSNIKSNMGYPNG